MKTPAHRSQSPRNVFLSLLACATLAMGNTPAPRNIILMISDGWGYNQIQATNLFTHGKVKAQAYENFPALLPITHYSTNGHGYDGAKAQADATYVMQKPTDSAASGTAFATGVKTYDAAIGVGPDSTTTLPNISEHAHRLGKSAGVVTTVQISHATPAAFLAHNPSRKNYAAIAREMLLQSPASVIVGAGHPEFDDDGKLFPVEKRNYDFVGGDSLWQEARAGRLTSALGPWTLAEKSSSFDSLARGLGSLPKRLFGVAQVHSTLQYNRKGSDTTEKVRQNPFISSIPSLATLSLAGLRVLNQNPKGFFLMIEGGAVDWAGHGNRSARLIEELGDFNTAVDSVIAWVGRNGGWENNLLIVTGDHETGYLTGAGTVLDKGTVGLHPIEGKGKGKMPAMQWNSGHHTNQLIPLYAKGPGAKQLSEAITGKDPLLGNYTDNAAVGRTLFALWPKH